MIALEIFLELGEESADERRRKLVFLNTADIHVQEVFAQMPNSIAAYSDEVALLHSHFHRRFHFYKCTQAADNQWIILFIG